MSDNASTAAPLPTATPATTTAPTAGYLSYLPVSLFASVMGLTGLSVAWRLAEVRFAMPVGISEGIGIVAVVAFIALTIGYAVKAATSPSLVVAEFRHPIAGNLFGTVLISLLLLPIIVVPVSQIVAQVLWVVGTVAMAILAWLIVGRWMSDRQQVAHATPAWIVPVVGLLDVPLAVPVLGLPPMHGVMMLGLAVGLFFAIPLFTLILYRLLFEPPMPESLQPTLMIMVAPFSVGFSAYVATIGRVDEFAWALYVLTLFILAVLVTQLRHFLHCCPFRVSWWAVSFPLAASAVCALRFAAAEPGIVTEAIAVGLLAFATIIIAYLLLRTALGIVRGELRTLSS